MSILVDIPHRAAPRASAGAAALRIAVRVGWSVLGWPLRVHTNRRLLGQMAGIQRSAHEPCRPFFSHAFPKTL